METSTLNSTDAIAARGQLVSSYVQALYPNYFYVHVPGCDRPALKLLNKHVRKHVSSKWHDLGLELLEQEDEETLNQIETNNPSDVSKCCKEMFQLWLRKCSTATWHQLIQALREVDLNNLATKIEGMLRDPASGDMSWSTSWSRGSMCMHIRNNILSHTCMGIPYGFIHDHVLYIAMNGLFAHSSCEIF